ncbi:MAG: response regulator transcription factor [Erysipelotrichaceae bacterium]|nr:response regulator transcription factor [Erysipelotrichaceae bacterium]
MANILICDDEKDIVNALKIYLSDPSYVLFEAYDGIQALEIIQDRQIDLVLLDIMMPKMDGITLLHKLRENYNMPVIILSAKSEDGDKVLGLNIGADDYISKPFNPLEVTARVNSQLRRYLRLGSNVKEKETYVIGGIVMDDRKKEVLVDDKTVNLTPKEYEILKLMMSHPDEVFSPKQIYTAVWKEEPYGAENTVAVHIRHLREKIEIDPAEPRYIKVIFGQGYKIGKGRRG